MTPGLSRWQMFLMSFASIIALALGGTAIWLVGARHHAWGPALRLEVAFDEIRGVATGTRVRVLGRDVGEVEAIDMPDRPSQPVVLHLCISETVHPLIRTDAVALIAAEGLLGGHLVELLPGTDQAAVIVDGSQIASRKGTDLAQIMNRINASLDALDRGSIGKLVKEQQAYDELMRMIRQGRGTMVSLQQDADAIKSMPIVRGYVRDPLKKLLRPDCRSDRMWFAESELFEPSSAILTAGGRERLDVLGAWLTSVPNKQSEIVVAAFAPPQSRADVALAVTQSQSEAVRDYLMTRHAVHKTGWFSRRKVTPVGCGTEEIVVDSPASLPSPCLEVIVHKKPG